jgi:hypothetical protein
MAGPREDGKMPKLPLAVDIAAAADSGDRLSKPLDVKAPAHRLKEGHPESNASLADIAGSLRAISLTPTA